MIASEKTHQFAIVGEMRGSALQDHVEREFALNVGIAQRAVIVQIAPCKYKSALWRRDAFSFEDLLFHREDGVMRTHRQSQGSSFQRFDMVLMNLL